MQMGSLKAGASRFAHLAGLGRASRRADEDNEDRHDTGAKKGRRADEEDDDERCDDSPESGDDGSTDSGGLKKKGRRADDDPDGDDGNADDDDKPAGKKSKRSRRADDGDDDEDDTPAAKRSKRADDGDDEDDDEDDDDKREMSGRSPAAYARRRERARCAAIFAHSAAAANPELAASLAFETTMTRREAIAVLRGQSGRSADRSYRSSRNPSLGSAPAQSREANIQASWTDAFKKVGKRG